MSYIDKIKKLHLDGKLTEALDEIHRVLDNEDLSPDEKRFLSGMAEILARIDSGSK